MSELKANEKLTWRQSSSWLHTWLGLFFGWVLFMVFVTGTLSVFRSELTSWLQPEVLQVAPADDLTSMRNSVEFLEHQGGASQWQITLPARHPSVELRWFKQGEKPSKRGGERATLDPQSGDAVDAQPTRFIDFLYRMHFELYSLPKRGARWFIGIATAAMFIALISGVVIHRRIFSDFFTFRPRKGQRSWLDFHNAVSVLALPFHLMITFSGLLLLMYLLIPWGIQAAFDGDVQQYIAAGGGRGGGHAVVQPLAVPPDVIASSNSSGAQLTALMQYAQQRWSSGVGSIRVADPTGQPSYTLTQRGAGSIVNRGQSESLRFDTKKQSLTLSSIDSISTTRAIYNVLSAWHLMRFAEPLQRWMYFIGGVAGSLMVASGLLLWSKRREQRYAKETLPQNLRWVSLLNVTAIMGLFVAFILVCWAKRVFVGTEIAGIHAEVPLFFYSWASFFVYAYLRHWVWYAPKKVWRESLVFCALAYAGLALVDMITLLPHISLDTLGAHILLSADGVLFAMALGAVFTLRWINKPAPSKRKNSRVKEHSSNDTLRSKKAVNQS